MIKICSGCKREFSDFESLRLSFGVCPDCGGPVIPKEIDGSELKYLTVFVADEINEAEDVKRILDENKMPYITRGDWQLQNNYIDFLVREDKIEEARALLKDIIDAEAVPAAEPLTAEEEQEVPQPPAVPKAVFNQSQTDDEGPNKVVILIVAFLIFAFLVILLNYLVKK